MERNGQKSNGHLKRNADAIRLLIDRDGHDVDDIARIIRWCQADEFWRTNILSASKLREKYGQLSAKAARSSRSAGETGIAGGDVQQLAGGVTLQVVNGTRWYRAPDGRTWAE